MTDFDLRYSSLRKAMIEREFEKLNDMQREAVFKTEGPLLLLAGAGSGKTTVLINRIINLLRFGSGYECEDAPEWAGDEELRTMALALNDPDSVEDRELVRLCAVNPPRPYEIIAITFTNKAAGELKDRLQVACGAAAHDIWAHTFHSACTRILRRDIERMGYSRDFTIYDEDDKKKLMASIIKDLGYDEKKFDTRGVASQIARAKDNLIGPEEYADQCGDDYYKKVVARVFAAYESRMMAANALDFDDIIVKTVQLLQRHQEVRDYYQHKFKYVLVDEYQDTNHAQYVLCSILAGGYGNFCVVGDDDQSIYKFRGATIANILEFEKQYPNAVTIRLEQNYRSTMNILGAANDVIAKNTERKGKRLWTNNEDGEKIHWFSGGTQEDEAQYIADQIKLGQSNGAKLKDFTVLYRNHALSNSIESAFKRNGIPYRIVSGLRFFDRAEVKDMLSYLWVVNNPSDTVRLRRIINVPARKIGAKAQEALAYYAEQDHLSEFAVAERAAMYPDLSRSVDALTRFTAIINHLRAKRHDTPLPELYDELLETSGYLAALKLQANREAEGRIENILELKSNIVEFCERSEEPTLEGFLEEISLLTDVDRYDTDADAVTMMTMHSAKGLEFPSVFLCGVEEGLFPSYRSMESPAELEEERRLCYVAMTRAKRSLYLTSAKRRMLYGQTSFAKPSRFIEEIPPDYLEEIAPRPSIVPPPPAPAARKVKPPIKRPEVSVSFGAPAASAATPDYHVNDRISHKAFGAGVVTGVTPMGGDSMLEVEFDKVGLKRFMAKSVSQYITKK